MTSAGYRPADGRIDGQGYVNVSILEGTTVRPAPAVAGAPFTGQPMRSILPGPSGTLRFDDTYLSKHVLFIGGIGTGKTNAMMHMLRDLRNRTGKDDVFVVFDTKGDFLEEFYRPGDAVISTRPEAQPGGVIWNLFADLLEEDPAERSDQIFEIASTIFSEDLDPRGAEHVLRRRGPRRLRRGGGRPGPPAGTTGQRGPASPARSRQQGAVGTPAPARGPGRGGPLPDRPGKPGRLGPGLPPADGEQVVLQRVPTGR